MEAIVNNLITAIGWSIVHSLWQSAIIYAMLFTILMCWPKMSSRLKHNLSFCSLLIMFVSFTVTFLMVFKLPSTIVSPVNLSQITYQEFIQFRKLSSFKTESYFPVVVYAYLIGIVLQVILLLSGYQKLKKLKHSSTSTVSSEWKAIFESTLSQLKINKTVKFYLSSKVNVPLVIGFFKPVVLFPIALATQLDAKQVEAILIHELSHIRRNDYLINLVKTCIETLLFFNPFVWLTTKFIQIEREHACDDLVVNFTGTPITYAHALLKLELLKNKQTPALSLAATGKNQHLYQRIKRITDMKTNYMNAKQQFLILSLTIVTVISLAWINPAEKPVVKLKKVKSLAQIKTTITEAKDINHGLVLKADTDTTKKKRKSVYMTTNQNGNRITYTSLDEMPDSVRKKYLEIEKKFNSAEWKEKMAKIEKNSLEIEKKFNSPEWKEKMAKIEKNGLELEKKFNSPEWKEKMAKIEKNSLELEKKFNSPEWKEKMAKIEKNGLELEKRFNSPQWKEKMAKIEKNGLELEKRFNSPQWKEKMAKIEKNGFELEKKFNSPEWKQKVEEMKKLQESTEYKELRKKYDSDLEELKKKKGIKNDKVFLFPEDLNLNNLSGELKSVFATTLPLTFKSFDFKFEDFKNFEALNAPLELAKPTTTPLKLKVN
jgi:bla regulator protein BlaR1